MENLKLKEHKGKSRMVPVSNQVLQLQETYKLLEDEYQRLREELTKLKEDLRRSLQNSNLKKHVSHKLSLGESLAVDFFVTPKELDIAMFVFFRKKIES
ncbi:hypothetical protein AKJ16_DCAP22241 [Drosera capensis]